MDLFWKILMRAAGLQVDAFDALLLARQAGSAKAVNIVLMTALLFRNRRGRGSPLPRRMVESTYYRLLSRPVASLNSSMSTSRSFACA